jgi:hypothetical protein
MTSVGNSDPSSEVDSVVVTSPDVEVTSGGPSSPWADTELSVTPLSMTAAAAIASTTLEISGILRHAPFLKCNERQKRPLRFPIVSL